MGNGYNLAVITHIKGTLLQTITSQEAEEKYGPERKKESSFLSKNSQSFLVISGLKMSAQDAYAHGDLQYVQHCM